MISEQSENEFHEMVLLNQIKQGYFNILGLLSQSVRHNTRL